MDHLQVVKEHVDVTLVAYVHKDIAVFGDGDVLQLAYIGIPMFFNTAAGAYSAKVAAYAFELLIEQQVVDVRFGYSSGCFIISTSEESRGYQP